MSNHSQVSKDVPAAGSLVEVRRGGITESRHSGHIAVLDGDGRLIASIGSPELVTYLRSSSKPQQAIPLITSAAADHFDFNEREIAIACGSHNADVEHLETVRSMLRKIGLNESYLKCGPHEPYSPEAAEGLRIAGLKPEAIHNNCSGKHAGMLAVARKIGSPVETYDEADNPVQLMMAREIARFSDIPEADLAVGIDGCGIPCFGVPVYSMALMYARLINPPLDWDEKTRDACRRIVHAMTAYPEMIGGRTASQDTALMRMLGNPFIAKAGAEGVFTGACLPCNRWPRGLAIALKIDDGDPGRRARRPAVTELLRQLEVISDRQAEEFWPYGNNPILNNRGDLVGEARASFQLEWVNQQ
jgi:L-asparaginase II